MEKLYNIMREIARQGGYSGSISQFDKWKFVTTWQFLKKSKKDSLYDEFACHELNLFIFFKDKEYFTSVVKPFIRNKIEKTLVDFFLLGNKEKLQEFANLNVIQDINTLELCLLVIWLAEHDPKKAKQIATYINDLNRTYHKDTQALQRKFDTILNTAEKSKMSEIVNLKKLA